MSTTSSHDPTRATPGEALRRTRVRLRRRFSLRSLLRAWSRTPVALKKQGRGMGPATDDGEDVDGPSEHTQSVRRKS